MHNNQERPYVMSCIKDYLDDFFLNSCDLVQIGAPLAPCFLVAKEGGGGGMVKGELHLFVTLLLINCLFFFFASGGCSKGERNCNSFFVCGCVSLCADVVFLLVSFVFL